MSRTKISTPAKKQDILALITDTMFKSISAKRVSDPVTKNLYSLLPKTDYLLTLVAIETEKGVIQISDKNEKDVMAGLNKLYTDSKNIHLFFVSAVPLSQEVVVESAKLGGNIKVKNLGAVLKYNWKTREWMCNYLGYTEMNAKQRELTEWRFDRGLVKFAETNKIKFIKTSVEPE